MTRLENDLCRIEIAVDESYSSGADFQSKYDTVINPNDLPPDDYSKAYSIGVTLRDRAYSVLLIGDCNCWDVNCAVIDDELLTILQGWDIVQFNVNTATVMRTVTLDTMAPNFEIYKVDSGYLIYGETNITMLNGKLETLWSFSGQDIIVSTSGKTPFEIKADRICLYDFEDNYYELDFNGNEIHA